VKATENEPDFYLASGESHGFEVPRREWRVRRIRSEHRNDLLAIRIEPPLNLKPPLKLTGASSEQRKLSVLVVATRHKGASLFPIDSWPVFVHIAEPLVRNVESREVLRSSEIKSIAWGELYRTEQDAREKSL
jgi:hypothetical protein